jgi:hypothetical protein
MRVKASAAFTEVWKSTKHHKESAQKCKECSTSRESGVVSTKLYMLPSPRVGRQKRVTPYVTYVRFRNAEGRTGGVRTLRTCSQTSPKGRTPVLNLLGQFTRNTFSGSYMGLQQLIIETLVILAL